MDQIVLGLKSKLDARTGKAEIHLDPPNLGALKVSLTLENVGRQSIVIGPLKILGMNAGDYSQTNNCGSAIAAHTNCTVSVTFAPGSTGSRNANVQFTSNGTGMNAVTPIQLTGIGRCGSPARKSAKGREGVRKERPCVRARASAAL